MKKVSELHPEVPFGSIWPYEIKYTDRQVYAAHKKVHVQLCKACPFLNEFKQRNDHGQIGECCAGRQERETYKMFGMALCDEKVTK